jgi:hypothetical protein
LWKGKLLMITFARQALRLGTLTALALLVSLSGCSGGGGFAVAPVRGKVTFDGQPVQGGVITFRPVAAQADAAREAGKPASAEVGNDGTFVLSTYGSQDGAVVGRHQVTYTPVSKGAESYEDTPAPSPYIGLVPEPAEVEVKSGANQIEIKLVKR